MTIKCTFRDQDTGQFASNVELQCIPSPGDTVMFGGRPIEILSIEHDLPLSTNRHRIVVIYRLRQS